MFVARGMLYMLLKGTISVLLVGFIFTTLEGTAFKLRNGRTLYFQHRDHGIWWPWFHACDV